MRDALFLVAILAVALPSGGWADERTDLPCNALCRRWMGIEDKAAAGSREPVLPLVDLHPGLSQAIGSESVAAHLPPPAAATSLIRAENHIAARPRARVPAAVPMPPPRPILVKSVAPARPSRPLQVAQIRVEPRPSVVAPVAMLPPPPVPDAPLIVAAPDPVLAAQPLGPSSGFAPPPPALPQVGGPPPTSADAPEAIVPQRSGPAATQAEPAQTRRTARPAIGYPPAFDVIAALLLTPSAEKER